MDLGNIKVGVSLELHCYKHNGKINTVSDKITIIDSMEDRLLESRVNLEFLKEIENVNSRIAY